MGRQEQGRADAVANNGVRFGSVSEQKSDVALRALTAGAYATLAAGAALLAAAVLPALPARAQYPAGQLPIRGLGHLRPRAFNNSMVGAGNGTNVWALPRNGVRPYSAYGYPNNYTNNYFYYPASPVYVVPSYPAYPTYSYPYSYYYYSY